jgi:hypothetical protein
VSSERAREREQEQEQEPDRETTSPQPVPTQASRILALQESAGNQAVARMLAAAGPTLARDPLPTGDDYMSARRAKEEYVRGGVRGPEDYAPSTNRGGFSVAYVPQVGFGAMNVHLRGAVNFKPGIRLVTIMGQHFATASSPAPSVAQAANAINQLPNDQREAAAAPWQWSTTEEDQFVADFQSVVEGAWKRKFDFRCTRPFWGDLGAAVNVFVSIHRGDRTDIDHMNLLTYKVPPNASAAVAGVVGVVRSRRGRDPMDNEMVLNSTDVRPRSDISLRRTIAFDTGADTIAAGSQGIVNDFSTRFQTGGTGPICGTCGQEIRELAQTPINLHVQGYGDDPQAAARRRFDALVQALVTGGMSDAATRARFHYDGEGDSTRMLVGNGEPQVVAAHEAGHMFGLADEYTAPFTSTSAGTLGNQSDPGLGQAQGLPAAVDENTDSMMSVGNVVKPQHYATFLEALKHISTIQEWEMGTPTGVVPPGVDGPLPTPPGRPGEPAGEPATALA